MKKIYILLMHTNTLPSKFVQMFTRYEYSHVAISLTKDCDTTYSFGRKNAYNILDGGFSVQNKKGVFFKRFNKTFCKIFEFEITDRQYEEVTKILQNMELNSDEYKYDFLGVVLRFFGIPVVFKNKYVCSYFVADVLERTNIYTFKKATCFVVPKNFEALIGAKKIYDGMYLEYR